MLNLHSLSEQTLLPGTKGLALHAPLKQSDIGAQHWNLLRGDTSFPVAVLKSSALQHNLAWMKKFCEQSGIVLAPHGKTTMSPQLFDMQLRNGAWGMTLANVNQMSIAHRYGVKKILLANQLVSPADIRVALHLMLSDPAFTFFALVDSVAGAQRLSQAVRDSGLQRPLPLLIELGLPGGRTGCRSIADALALARAVSGDPYLQLAGIEGYEGLLPGKDIPIVRQFISELIELTRQADAEHLFGTEEIILSAGGSAYFDLVGRQFSKNAGLSRPILPILRSGCYVTHDHAHYQKAIQDMQLREPGMKDGLHPALEVWSMVQSLPEPGLAILTMGKRDASYDMDLPVPLSSHRPGDTTSPRALPPGCKIEKMNDQHAYLRLPPDSETSLKLAVGDLISCGISHPCTTFDKWPLLLIVNDAYDIESAVNTLF
ncbi:amino acid deaminase [Undibacterium terreum]|uniref:Deaminase n=1 Tax=Undibacterium terreum TaxID=1224302 RepID=A0A916XIV3_9BURK|nr:amino acid deaminase [Undibacterium terreum]GGC74737.1 deaminase [Undibacterium terreum]